MITSATLSAKTPHLAAMVSLKPACMVAVKSLGLAMDLNVIVPTMVYGAGEAFPPLLGDGADTSDPDGVAPPLGKHSFCILV